MVNVIKALGQKEPFSEIKVRNSIRRAGIPQEMQEEVLKHVKTKIYENIHTSEIYKHIIEFLEVSPQPFNKTKYRLKQAIMDLGPTGYPFEDYVAEILKTKGYQTQVRQILEGKCVSHEIDIIAEKDGQKILIEAKFHNSPGTRSDVHVSLYTKARFEDLKQKHSFTHAMLVTNTKITSDALSYANCEEVKVLSWSYPDGGSLRELVDKHKLYPVTQLPFLSFSQKQELLNNNVVLIKQICENPNLLNQITIPKNKREEIIKEAKSVCGY